MMVRAAGAAALALLALALAAGAPAVRAQDPLCGQGPLFPRSNCGLRPQSLVTFGSTHYFQMAENPIGTVVFFHGCSRSARNFFPYHPQYCPECLGFPEHLSHTKQALARGYNVLALDPDDDRNFCFSSSAKKIGKLEYVDDQPRAIATLRYFVLTRNLTHLPVYLWGASAGGTLALKMMGRLYRNDQYAQMDAEKKDMMPAYTLWGTVQGVIAEAATPTDFDASDSNGKLLWPGFPPTIFVRMERDGAEGDVAQNLAFFRRNGVPSDVLVAPVRRITPTYFSDRTPTITDEQSARIVEGLKEIGLLGEGGYLLANPKDDDDPKSPAFRWAARLQALLPWLTPMSKSLSLVLKFSPIQQAMMVAYAQHDAVSDYFTACLAWLEGRGREDAAALGQRLMVPGGRLSDLTPDRKYPSGPYAAVARRAEEGGDAQQGQGQGQGPGQEQAQEQRLSAPANGASRRFH